MKKQYILWIGFLLAGIVLLCHILIPPKTSPPGMENVFSPEPDLYPQADVDMTEDAPQTGADDSLESTDPGESSRIALTFDDGPHPVYTEEMLEVLSDADVKASFFLLGENIEQYPEEVKAIADGHHLIGNHTYHHVQITSLSCQEACSEISQTNKLIEELTGQQPQYVRPPFGTWNKELEENLDMIPVLWTVDTLDWTTANVDQIVGCVQKHVQENSIILMHDSYESTVQAVKRLIPLLQAEGYEFVTVDELIGM